MYIRSPELLQKSNEFVQLDHMKSAQDTGPIFCYCFVREVCY